MAVISIRLNKDDEKILDYLKDYYKDDKSSLIKKIIQEKYEDLQDLKVINNFEENYDKNDFFSFEDIVGKK